MEDEFTDSSTDFWVGFCGLIRGEACFAFELGFRILLQPKEKVGRYGFSSALAKPFLFLPLLGLL